MNKTNPAHSQNSHALTIVLVSIFVAFLFSSCGPGVTSAPTQSIDQQYTQAAKTVIAEMTLLAPTEKVSVISPTPIDTPDSEQVTQTATLSPTETQQPTPTVTPTASEGVPPLPDYGTLLDDEFSSNTGWYAGEEENFGFSYTDSGYLIYVNILNATIWSIRETELTDSRVEVSAEQIAGPKDGYYGVSCRHQDGENYYSLVISNNGQYGIIKMERGEAEFIQEGTAPDNVINPNGENNVVGDCIGDTLTLYANQKKLTEIRDNTFQSGIYGLIVGTRRNEGVEVEFRRIILRAP